MMCLLALEPGFGRIVLRYTLQLSSQVPSKNIMHQKNYTLPI